MLEALQNGLVSNGGVIFCHCLTPMELTVTDAITMGILDPVTAKVWDPFTDELVDITEAVYRELLIDNQSKVVV